MTNQKEIQISSNWTTFSLYAQAIICLIFLPVMGLAIASGEFHFGKILGLLGLMALVGFMVYQFIYVATAKVSDDKLILKKQFRPEKSYEFSKIGYPTSFQIKRTKYTSVKMKNNDGTFENYMIINSNAILSFENKDAEAVLMALPRMAAAK
jgi:hypothetical protein